MNLKKIFGWILLIIGLAIIFVSLYFSFSIFTNRSQAPNLFKIEESEIEVTSSTGSSLEDIQENLEKAMEEQIKNMIPKEFLAQLLDLIAWSVFAGLLIFGGSRLSSIGINLIRQ